MGAGTRAFEKRLLATELLVAAPPRAGVTFGAPAWVVLADARGNPTLRDAILERRRLYAAGRPFRAG